MRIPVSSNVDVRSLATILHSLRTSNIHPKDKSELVSIAVDSLAFSLAGQQDNLPFKDEEGALNYLKEEGFDFTSGNNKRQSRKILTSLSGVALTRHGSEKVDEARVTLEEVRKMREVDKPEMPGLSEKSK